MSCPPPGFRFPREPIIIALRTRSLILAHFPIKLNHILCMHTHVWLVSGSSFHKQASRRIRNKLRCHTGRSAPRFAVDMQSQDSRQVHRNTRPPVCSDTEALKSTHTARTCLLPPPFHSSVVVIDLSESNCFKMQCLKTVTSLPPLVVSRVTNFGRALLDDSAAHGIHSGDSGMPEC